MRRNMSDENDFGTINRLYKKHGYIYYITYSLPNLNCNVKCSPAYKVFSAPSKDIRHMRWSFASTSTLNAGKDFKSCSSLLSLEFLLACIFNKNL